MTTMNGKIDIEKLLEKYYLGETNTAEEALLEDYFASRADGSPESLQFDFYKSESEIDSLDSGFDDKIFAMIEAEDSLLAEHKPVVHKLNKQKFYFSLAAVIAIIAFSAFWWFDYFSPKSGVIITDANFAEHEELARATTADAFELIAQHIDKANSGLNKLQLIDKGLNSMNAFELINFYSNRAISKED